MVHIKSVEEYEDEEYHDYSDDGDGNDVFEATTFHPNSVLPAEAMDKASLLENHYIISFCIAVKGHALLKR